MAESKEKIIKDIANCFKGIPYKNCYIGITSDPERRLFVEHKVSRESGRYIYRTASSHAVAREIERYFVEKGMQGGTGGGDKDSRIVYAYQKTKYTDP